MKKPDRILRRYLDEKDLNIFIHYTLGSSLGPVENNRYCLDIWAKAVEQDESGNDIAIVGEMHAFKLLIGVGINNGWNAESIFDSNEYTYELGKLFYNYKKNKFLPEITKYYDDYFESDILIINDIELIPQYRGIDIAPFMIKDLCNNFGQAVSLAVIDLFPNQFSDLNKHEEKIIEKQYDKFGQNFNASFHKLQNYFEKMGFEQIPKISRKLMFLNLNNSNKKYDEMELD